MPDDWSVTLPPVLIVGFWRSGTTLLHEMLAADRSFAAPSLIDVLCPADAPYLRKAKLSLTGAIATLMPATRVVDSVAVTPRSPQEEEAALCHLGAPSSFAAAYFPKRREAILEEALFFDGAPDARERWRAAHDHFMRLLTVKYPGRRILLKNPSNSTRIPDLLALYPRALFVRIDRDPAEVVPSFQRMTDVANEAFSLQGRAPPLDREAAIRFHARVMAKLDADWPKITPERRVEVRYETFAPSPLRGVDAIYESLGLERSVEARRRQKRFWLRRGRTWSPPAIAAAQARPSLPLSP
ncbi:sulfotransferase family protein [Methylopila henanensis]|uniref:Sulfotransferase family protein n=1 Tax=Methylopila henanensis TaxID=873516 RepID=A0ABW4K8P3_9HYPH